MPPKFRRDYQPLSSHEPERESLLDGNDDSDDDLLGGARNDVKMKRIQTEVDGVVDVMHDNINRVMMRGDMLDDLQDKSENLASNADVFRSRSKSLRSQLWWKECRMRIILAIIITVILCIIIIPIIIRMKQNGQL